MTMTVMKTNFERLNPKVTHYWGYERFCDDTFENISYLHYRLKTLILTAMDLKNFYRCLSRPWATLHHVRKKYLG